MRFAALVLVVAAACGDNAIVTAVPLVSGAATLTLSADHTALVFARGEQPLLTFHADAFEVGTVADLDSGESFDPYWLFVDPPVVPDSLVWHVLDATDAFDVRASTPTHLVIAAGDALVTFDAAAADCLTLKLTSSDAKVAYLRVRPDADPTEGFYGLGEWGDSVNHRGKLRPMQMEGDFTMEGADDENHVPVPLVIGTRGWGMFAMTDRAGAFDVARQSDTRIDATFGTGDASSDGLLVHLFSAAAPLDVLAHYYDITGYPGIPAPWAYGPLLWRNGNASQAQVIDDISQIRTRHLATSGIWFDRPFATGVETFDFDPTKFPDAPTMLAALHDAGLRYGVWHTPYTAPANASEDPAPVQHDYATAHSFFPPVTGVLVNQWGKPIDFTNADAYAWWQQELSTYTLPLGGGGLGVEGFKLDYGEDIVVGLNGQRTPWQFADGSDERTMHRGYTLLYHQIYRDQLAHDGAFLLTRTGRWGDQTKGMIIWPGDLDATFDRAGAMVGSTKAVGGLPAAVIKGLSLSASGFPFYASDTAGYRHSPATNECWSRWVEANAVASAMEVGDASSAQPWEFTADNGRTQHSLDVYQKYAALHLRLFPYAWTAAQDIAHSGRPIVRPFGLAFPEAGAHPDDEFAFGDAILVAPIVTQGATSREVVFPVGTWIDWWTGERITGPATKTVTADLDTLPLYVRAGGLVPMLRDTIDTLAPVTGAGIESFANDPGVLWVRASNDAAQATIYDGTELTATATTFHYTPGSVFTAGVMFEVIASAQPLGVHDAGGVLAQTASLAALKTAGSGWFWEPATGGTLWILLPGMGTATVDP
ncbi:MAG: TIM-barrel domain-containing protein [Deltaproteobacteria bacterium]